MIARERYKAPKTYAEAFVILVDQGILPKEKETTFIKMAKFRNRIVHLYQEVDDREVYAIMKESLADSQAFVRAIVNKVL
ncbi:HepT-like ribonuclease domain-containing protein [Peptococcaceae bacterium 1198_IL3148]